MSDDDGWYGIDLDGTLAKSAPRGSFSQHVIGEPIPSMVELVCKLIDEGKDVRIFTARVGPRMRGSDDPDVAELVIRHWCLRHLGCELPVTCVKDAAMKVLYDNRAITVETDTGRVLELVESCEDYGAGYSNPLNMSCPHCPGALEGTINKLKTGVITECTKCRCAWYLPFKGTR